MPPDVALANRLPYTPNRLITASAVFILALWTSTGVSYGRQPEADIDDNLLSSSPLPEAILSAPPSDSIGLTSPARVDPWQDPVRLAQVYPGTIPQSGVSVPWNAVQGHPGVPYGAPPVGTTGTSAMPPGQWTMVWMPHTIPVAGGPGQPVQTTTAYFPVWAYVGLPNVTGQMAQPQIVSPQIGDIQGIYPSASFQQGYPQGIPPNPYGPGYPLPPNGTPDMSVAGTSYTSNGYIPPFHESSNFGATLPAQPRIPPYLQGGPATGQFPLNVPTLPDAGGYGAAAIPLPSASTQQFLPTTPQSPALSAPFYSGPAVGLASPPPSPNQPPGISAVAVETVPTSNGVVDAPNRPIAQPNLDLQGLYVLQGENSSARARLFGDAFLTPNLAVGGALDLVTGPDLTNDDGVELTELYLAASVPGAPGLRFRLGQLDLTSYFDRNSFAKDIARDFFNSTFHTNPALIAGANATASRPAGLVQWAVTDDIALNAAVFSSSSDITDFALDGFAGEVDFRTGNLIVRGTFLTARDTQFQGSGGRLDSYGVNAEWFIPEANLGLFGRYGHLNNSNTGFSGDTYGFGLNALDVFMENDRLGLGYGRNLETTVAAGETPDVLELFYDFEVTPNIRLGFTLQQRDQLQESYAGFRVRGNLDLLPQRSGE